MKKKVCIVLGLMLLGSVQFVQAQKLFGVGLQGGFGANYASINENSGSGTANFQDIGTKYSPNIGAFINVNPKVIDNIILHGAVGFRQRGFAAKSDVSDFAGAGAVADYTVNNSYLNMDLVLRTKMNLPGPIKPYVGIGFRSDLKVATKATYNSDFANKDAALSNLESKIKDGYKIGTLSAVVSVGIAVSIVNVELEWNPDLTSAYNSSTTNSKNSVINLNVGLRLYGF
jgi:hypothetical protein